ncbi:hypothetical protein [Cupriavidus sp. YAF13]|uniref:hypothetical protein n=1 Tax=Cupriavidus sp. YAF13 TaxID=3233075 RepID=UPI003F8EA6BA
MKVNLSFRVLLSGVAALATTLCYAGASTFVAGQQLSPAQWKSLAGTTVVRLGSQSFQTLPASAKNAGAAGSAVTLVVNDRGVVGESRNEVVVSQVSTQEVQQTIGKLSHAAIGVQYFDHMSISQLTFASFQDAVNAREQLKTLLAPGAAVDVPIRYGKPKVR